MVLRRKGMSWWGWVIVVFAGLLGTAFGWAAAVIVQALLSEPNDVWGDEGW